MKSMSCLAGPTTPGLLVCLLVMRTMVKVHGEVLGQRRTDKNKANTQRDSDELMDDSRCGNSEHFEKLQKFDFFRSP